MRGLLCDQIAPPVFSPDSRRIAYVVGKDSKFIVVVDGTPFPPCDNVGSDGVFFSPDSKHSAYAAKVGQENYFVIDGFESPHFDGIVEFGASKIAFDSGGSLEFLAVKGGTLYRVGYHAAQ